MTCQFSIVVPTYNRPQQLMYCLTALAHLSYPRESFEVIVVNDGGGFSLDELVQQFHHRLHLRLLRITNSGPGVARNHGAAIARGRFLAFTDDDCQPAADWLQKLDGRLRKRQEWLIGGHIRNLLQRNIYAATSHLIHEAVYAFYNRVPEAAYFVASNNMAIATDLFRDAGGFMPLFRKASEDREFCDRWRSSGRPIIYDPDIVIFHAHQLTFSRFWGQHFNYGRGAFHYQRLRHERHGGSVWDESQFHRQLPRLLRKPLANISPWYVPGVLLLLACWQLAYLAGFMYERYRASQKRSSQ